MTEAPRHMRELSAARSFRLLAGVSLGRIAFTSDAMPQIRPVNHVLDDEDIIIRSHIGAAILATHGQVVSYEADELDRDSYLGWCVIVLGKAQVVQDPAEVERCRRMVRPWVDRQMDYVIRVSPKTITGYEIIDAQTT